jgi:hypothetical protein
MSSNQKKRGSSVFGAGTLENLRHIRPDEWNNIPLPVTEAIKIIVNEMAIMNSRLTKHGKDIEEVVL